MLLLVLQMLTLTIELGVTVGVVVIPQGMAYAKLAQLPVQFGLYSSFMGALVYWIFGTSKDINIGVSMDMSCHDLFAANWCSPSQLHR
jgi:sodium-independent sulfate anion transporter 11